MKQKKSKISKRELLEKIISYIELKKQNNLEAYYLNMWKDEEYLSEMKQNTIYLGNI